MKDFMKERVRESGRREKKFLLVWHKACWYMVLGLLYFLYKGSAHLDFELVENEQSCFKEPVKG
jgi:hypothetical protein